MKVFPLYTQPDTMDCGPCCLRMIARFYGKSYSLETLRERSFITREGVSLLGISDAAESIGFRTAGIRISFKQLVEDMTFPCILHWNQNHFVVCIDIKKKNGGYKIKIADPAAGISVFEREEFERCWCLDGMENERKGIALHLQPRPEFYHYEDERTTNKKFIYLLHYFIPFKKELMHLIFGMICISFLQLIFPFLTQSLVDIGIRDSNLNFVTLILVAQLIVSISQLSVEFIRNWIMLHMNTRIDIALISDFLAKLMKLPLKFFDTKMIGDIMQRIDDHNRIRSFLTGSSISTLFSFLSFFLFGIILAYYNLTIFGVFIIGNALYLCWILIFMKYRRELDVRRFSQSAHNQSNLVQLITGMQDIKLNNCERQKRWEWERIQIKLFRISLKELSLSQIQQVGSVFFNQTTNIVISFIAAKAVIDGQITLGMMLSLTYIIGQLNAPISSVIDFAQQLQDAKISLERLNEIHGMKDEEQDLIGKLTNIPPKNNILIENLSFSYSGSDRHLVLKNINIDIEHHKITAIVGASGSGKTTLVKLLLGFYTPNKGLVKVGNIPLERINPHFWRSKVGSVMQDGFIFSDSVLQNIVIGEEYIDNERLDYAIHMANLYDFIQSLPLGYNTKIGMEGNGISQGQRQRILIARAIYKNPEFIFLDEATNSLDANNEKEIIGNLSEFYKGKTVVIVAHRLSTVRNADKIVVLDKGNVAEVGNHTTLIEKRGFYYALVKNQLL